MTGGTNDKNDKLGQRGSGTGHVTYFCNFWTHCISCERFEINTSNGHADCSPGELTTKMSSRSKGVGKGSRDLLLKYWDPLVISEQFELETFKFGVQIDHWGH